MGLLDRDHSVAPVHYNRWLIPPAALAIHLAIGQVYSFSVFKNPLIQAFTGSVSTANLNKDIGYIFSIAIAFLGLSAALFGAWLEKAGPRRAMFYAACCFGLGFLVASLGVQTHQLWLVYLGYGVIGGIGLGLGYISPVSTLIKWFPDRPGLATGLAIMGFGGGAMIGGPLATQLMAHFRAAADQTPTPGGPLATQLMANLRAAGSDGSAAIAHTMVVMGLVYFAFMMFGVFTIRVPNPAWSPKGYVAPTHAAGSKDLGLISSHDVAVTEAWRTPQFWLLWIILFTNVTAGIGILEEASPMIQDLFRGQAGPAAAVGFVGLLSILNMAGRFFWASTSDFLGRKATYFAFFTLGPLLFFFLPFTSSTHLNSIPLFVTGAAVIISMYGGGFATIPAYLKDLFGGYNVSAIHGRLLTAWSTAGIVGPLIVNGILDHYVTNKLPREQAYPLILHIMTALLCVGFLANLLVRPVADRFWIKGDLDLSKAGPAH